ncbi:MAG TPA: TadE/TadG family type IV pilus assembly protein [Planctomycetaceae bacterium]|nr:TadE/TadG family type IV pilus assembly protein [Planctomycetaceae bacterium]
MLRSPLRSQRTCQRAVTHRVAPWRAVRSCSTGLRSTRCGAAAVEAAIVMNIFLLFIFAIMEFGHFVMVKQLMDNAARDGARLAATGQGTVTTAQIQALITQELVNQGPTNMNIQVFQANPTTGANVGAWTSASLGQPIAVQITGQYKPMVALANLLPLPINVTSEAIIYSEFPN